MQRVWKLNRNKSRDRASPEAGRSSAAIRCRISAGSARLRVVADHYISARAAQIKSSVDADWTAWPATSNPNGDRNMSFDEAVSSLKSNLNRRLNQMTNEVNNNM